MDNLTLGNFLRARIDPDATLVKFTNHDRHGTVMWSLPPAQGRVHGQFNVHRWATHRTDDSPVEAGIMFWSGGYHLNLSDANDDYDTRPRD